jgi:tRNA 2-thiocytidine biosynthesis protein TtcA
LCGSQVNLQRAQIKQMLREWERHHPGRVDNMAAAMGRITLSHLMDRNLHPFATLQATGVADHEGDKAFDDDDCSDTHAERPMRIVQGAAGVPAAP